MYDFIIIFAFALVISISNKLSIVVNFINRLDKTLELQEKIVAARLKEEMEKE